MLVLFCTRPRDGRGGLFRARLDAATGRLGEPELALPLEGTSFAALRPQGDVLYVTAGRYGAPEGEVAALRLGADGQLTEVGRASSRGKGPCYLATDRAGRTLLVANYGSGHLAALGIAADGTFDGSGSVHRDDGRGPDTARQDGPHAHSIRPSPDGRHVYAADLGTDRVLRFTLAAEGARLSLVESLAVEAGSGPRHVEFGQGGRIVFVIHELNSTVSSFARDPGSGRLTRLGSVSMLPDGADATTMNASELQLHRGGRTLFCASRDLTGQGRDCLGALRVDADGRLTRIATVSAEVRQPRHFAIDPSGRWLCVAGQGDDAISVFDVGASDGTPTFTGQRLALPTPMHVLFVPAAT